MRLVEMTCNHCNAQLEIDLDKMQAFCPYCGKKLMVDVDKLSDILLQKEKTRQEKQEQDFKLEDKRISYQHEQTKQTINYKMVLVLFIGLLAINVLLWGMIASRQKAKEADEKQQVEQLVSQLEEVESEIEEAIKAGDYDTALIKANQLRPDNRLSSSEVKAWNEKRETYIKLIKEKQRE